MTTNLENLEYSVNFLNPENSGDCSLSRLGVIPPFDRLSCCYFMDFMAAGVQLNFLFCYYVYVHCHFGYDL